jgi:hypothetical protein
MISLIIVIRTTLEIIKENKLPFLLQVYYSCRITKQEKFFWTNMEVKILRHCKVDKDE